MNGVDEEIERSEAAGEEGTPLPMVVLWTRDRVTAQEEEDGHLLTNRLQGLRAAENNTAILSSY